jgi:hypothetical protein
VIPIEPFKEDGEGVLESDGFGLTEGPTVEIRTFPAGHDFPFAHALGQIANRRSSSSSKYWLQLLH